MLLTYLKTSWITSLNAEDAQQRINQLCKDFGISTLYGGSKFF